MDTTGGGNGGKLTQQQGQGQGPTAADAVEHVKARFTDLKADVMQRQGMEVLSLVARASMPAR